MYPHERSLVKQFARRPFVIIGVNSDPQDRLRQTIARERMSWRSWWDGGHAGGPIARAWEVRGWPTLVVIDARGIIRARYLGEPSSEVLDHQIERWLRQAERGGDGAPKP